MSANRIRPMPASGVLLIVGAIYFVLGSLIGFGGAMVVGGAGNAADSIGRLAENVGRQAGDQQGARQINDQRRELRNATVTASGIRYVLALLYMVTGVSQAAAGIACFTGAAWMKKGIVTAGALGVASCLGAVFLWGFGFMRVLFLILSGVALLTTSSVQRPEEPLAPSPPSG